MKTAFIGMLWIYLLSALALGAAAVAESERTPPAVEPAAEAAAEARPYQFKATPAILELRKEMHRREAEARCKSNKTRLISGECD